MYPVHRASIFSLENVERVYKNNPPAKKKKKQEQKLYAERLKTITRNWKKKTNWML